MGRSTLEIKGFDEFYQKLQKIGAEADAVAEKTFDECMDILEEELKTKASAAGVPSKLINKITRSKISTNGVFYGSVGWKSQKNKTAGGISDFHKVIFLNYGTPSRSVRKEFQHVRIDGKWVTLKKGRGEIIKRGFIKRAKNSAKRRTKALMKSKMHEILGD